MTQLAYIENGYVSVQIELPDEDIEVIDGIRWGDVSGFPTLAYWLFRILERRLQHKQVKYKLGSSLLEEVAACLLGGHGIPASMGIASFEHLRGKGAFSGEVFSEKQLYSWLSEPIYHKGQYSKYRFSGQKAKYLHSSMQKLSEETPPCTSGKELRNWLMSIRGIGPKTASWVARNWLDADDVAILDIHIYRAGILANFFQPQMTVEKNYFELESQFINVARGLKVSAAELDAVMWYEMQGSTRVHRLLAQMMDRKNNLSPIVANQSNTKPHQLTVL